MKIVIVIPARYGSTRFPGKPLAQIRGRSMIERIWGISCAVKGVDDVYVATDDTRIEDGVVAFGGKVIQTNPACENGTERALDAISKLKDRPDAVINFQGDAVLTPPWIVQALVDALRAPEQHGFVTPAVQLSWAQLDETVESKKTTPFSGTFVTFNQLGQALYFSKNIIPAVRNKTGEKSPVYQHIGMYGYRTEVLERYVKLTPGTLERSEGLEQLRALEAGIPIQVVPVDYRGRTSWAVDSPEDLVRVEEIIGREGELL